VPLQETGSVGRTVTFLGEKVHCRLGHLDSLALALHLTFEFLEIEFGDAANFIHGERRKHDDLVDAIAKLRREALALQPS
jgi:hypothetical protein